MSGVARGCLLLSVLAALLASCACSKTLVLVDSLDIQYSHSLFFSDLRDRGHDLEFALINSKKLRLQSYGTWLYDNVAIFSSQSTDFGGALDVKYLVEFVDAGNNVLVAATSASEAVIDFAGEMGSDFLDQGSQVQDHVSFDARQGPSFLLTSQTGDVPAITGDVSLPVLYAGAGLTTAPNPLLTMNALTGSISTVSFKDQKAAKVAGSSIVLSTAMQTHYNGRVSVSGSVHMFSDAAFAATVEHSLTGEVTATGNRNFCRELALWTFKDKGVLRLSGFRHRREGQQEAPPLATYTVTDMITVEADLFENRDGEWVPHESDSVLAQFVMLDPYIRQAMSHDGRGHYSLTVKAPDVYGVFKWVLDYKKRGYTFVHFEEVTPLRPFRHNEYPRFIVQAYPYYAAVMSVSAGFLVMITLVMFHKPAK